LLLGAVGIGADLNGRVSPEGRELRLDGRRDG
jgi:hypothetical protein